jgi:hypothetical protein
VIASPAVAVAFTVVFAVTGVFHLRRCALLWSAGPVAGRDPAVELGHLLMSLGMIAMVWAWGGSVSRWLQIVVFGLLAVLFVARVLTARAGAGLHTGRPAFGYHALATGAMTWMVAATVLPAHSAGAGGGGHHHGETAMAMAPADAAAMGVTPMWAVGVSVALAVALAASAFLWATASARTSAPAPAAAVHDRAAGWCHALMGLAMAAMLLVMV